MSVKRNGKKLQTIVHRILSEYCSIGTVKLTRATNETYLRPCYTERDVYASFQMPLVSNVKNSVQFSWRLQYPSKLVNATILQFISNRNSSICGNKNPSTVQRTAICRKSKTTATRPELKNGLPVTPIFTSKKIDQVPLAKETKPSFACVVHLILPCDLGDANYVGYTSWHLYTEPFNCHSYFFCVSIIFFKLQFKLRVATYVAT